MLSSCLLWCGWLSEWRSPWWTDVNDWSMCNKLGQDIQTLTYHSSTSIWLIIWKMYVVSNFRGRLHIAPKTRGTARRAAFSFFQSARAVALRRRLSLSNHQLRSPLQEEFRHMTCGALAAFWKVKMFLSLRGRAWKKTSASLPLCASIPRVYIWNNELERAKDAIFKWPLTWPLNMMLT